MLFNLYFQVWKVLPGNIQVQLCPEHSSWQGFLYAFEALKDGEVTVPDTCEPSKFGTSTYSLTSI